jgi:hypothetical protein
VGLKMTFKKIKNPKNIILQIGILIGALFFIFITVQTHPSKQNLEARLISPPHGLEHFSFGFKAPLADLMWIRVIQDFDYCEKKIDNINCSNTGWLYQMLDVVTDLAPDFRTAYSAGSIALSVIVSDIQGASLLFEKGLKHFPKDWIINYRAAYHFLIEVKNKTRAAELLVVAAQNGGPPWLYSLATRLYTEEGQNILAVGIYKQLLEEGASPSLIEQVRKKLNKQKIK